MTINFNISGTGCAGSPAVCTIALTTPLPPITTAVLIDGYMQPLSSANTLAVGNKKTVTGSLTNNRARVPSAESA